MSVTTRSSIWRPGLSATTGLSIVLILLALFTVLRGAGTFGTIRFLAPVSFVLMAITPWLLLSKQGRTEIGLRQGASGGDYGVAILAGAGAAVVCFGLGVLLFGETPNNWFVSVAGDYAEVPGAANFPPLILHAVFTVPALIFSPIGEEIFFRGVLLGSLAERTKVVVANVLQAAAFGLVHLLHHGLEIGDGGVVIRPGSAVLWVVLMFGVALMFGALRLRSGSLYPAMASHAVFNLVMNLTIFTFLWPL